VQKDHGTTTYMSQDAQKVRKNESADFLQRVLVEFGFSEIKRQIASLKE